MFYPMEVLYAHITVLEIKKGDKRMGEFEINYMDEFINALKEDRGYDYIANNAHNFSKEELKRIILELLYELINETHKPNIENAIEELEEFYAD